MSADALSILVIARRYAAALFALAKDAGAAPAVQADLQAFRALVQDSPELKRFLNNPTVTKAQGMQAANALLDALKASPLTRKFVATLVENRRLAIIPAVADAFSALLADANNEATATVRTAKPLPAATQKTLADSLSAATTKKIQLDVHHAPELLGGFTVTLAGKTYDNSLQTRLSRLAATLKNAA